MLCYRTPGGICCLASSLSLSVWAGGRAGSSQSRAVPPNTANKKIDTTNYKRTQTKRSESFSKMSDSNAADHLFPFLASLSLCSLFCQTYFLHFLLFFLQTLIGLARRCTSHSATSDFSSSEHLRQVGCLLVRIRT